MSYDQSSSPHSTPPALTPAKPGDEPKMRYMYAFQYIFENPQWTTNVLLATLCFLIPVVGPIVLLGYQFQIIESLLLRRAHTYPDFDFNKFSELLMRGVWPFLAAMIVQMVITPVVMVLVFGGIMCTGTMTAAVADSNEGLGVACFFLGMVFVFLATMGLSILLGLAMMPMMLAAGLSQEFGPAFNMAFIKDFIGRVWKEMILSSLFISLVSMLLMPLGLLVFCVGVYAAMAVVVLANAHILYQLYNLYLARGGMALAMKEQK